jgi:hypothetical protein
MSIETQRQELFGRLQGALATQFPNVPIAWPNIKFDQPDGPFVLVNILLGDQTRQNLGPNYTVRHISVLQFDIYTPEDTGTKLLGEVAEFLAKHFREQEYQLSDGDRLLVKPPQMTGGAAARGFERLTLRFPLWRDALD